jgi:HSP20 family protein
MFTLTSTRDPFGEMRGLLRRMDDIFSDFDRPLWGVGMGSEAWPAVDLRDKGDVLVLQADVPGMSEKDVAIEVTGQSITLRGEKKVEPPKGYNAHRTERRSVKFARSIGLPCEIDLEAVTATVKNGVLTVQASKRPEARPKQITVKAS